MDKNNQHPAIIYTQELQDICLPLQKLNISYFCHANITYTGRFTALCNHGRFSQHYIEKKYYEIDIHTSKALKEVEYVIWDSIELKGLALQMNQDAVLHGARHPFTLIQKNDDSVDYYHFATHRSEETINQVYLHNRDLLKLFILYFKEKIAALFHLQKAYQMPFIISDDTSSFSAASQIPYHEKNMRKAFLDALYSHKHPLSNREFSCLQLIAKNFTAKQIARELNISHRTVELHIQKILEKLGFSSKAELISNLYL